MCEMMVSDTWEVQGCYPWQKMDKVVAVPRLQFRDGNRCGLAELKRIAGLAFGEAMVDRISREQTGEVGSSQGQGEGIFKESPWAFWLGTNWQGCETWKTVAEWFLELSAGLPIVRVPTSQSATSFQHMGIRQNSQKTAALVVRVVNPTLKAALDPQMCGIQKLMQRSRKMWLITRRKINQ